MIGLTLVTGGTGFIGTYLVRQLVERGERVRVLVRRRERIPRHLRERVEILEGDICEPRALARATRGIDTIYHLAACAKAWSRNPNEFRDVNVCAVERLLDEATRNDVTRLVHVSTLLTLPPFRPARTDGRPRRPTPYETTKWEGERIVASYARSGRHAVVVYPTRVFGPGPLNDANGVTKVIALYLRGRFRLRLDDGDALNNYVHAADVATGIRLAGAHGRSATGYLLGGDNVSFTELLNRVSELSGIRRTVLALPPGAAVAIARGAEWWGALGGRTAITSAWVRTLLEDRRTDCTLARQDLGYRPRPLDIGLAQTVRWLQHTQLGRAA
jgi:farnesol dehydrogenase